MRSIILIAPPAAGKGTQSELISLKYGFTHISTGELLREVALTNDDLKQQLSTGYLISDSVIFDLLENRLKNEDCKKGFILDGFPRTVNQAKKYELIMNEIGVSSNVVIFLDIDKNEAFKRIEGRVTCPKCNRVYNELLEDVKPKVLGICDKCGIELIKRSDDNFSTFSNRYDVYYENTAPLIEFYEEKGILHKIDCGIGKDSVFEVIQNIIGDIND